MRRRADSNRRTRFCRPLPNHSATSPYFFNLFSNNKIIITGSVRPTGIEPVTYGLEGRCSIRLSYGRSTFNIKTRCYKEIIKKVGKRTKLSNYKMCSLTLFSHSLHLQLMSGRPDSNWRPSAPKADALTGLRYAPKPQRAKFTPRKESPKIID